MELELIEVPDSFYNYNVLTSDGKELPANRNIKHYRGTVKGESNSLVAISFFEKEVIGVVSTSDGNFNISLDKESGKHLYYNEKNVPTDGFSCDMVDDTGELSKYKPEVLSHLSKKSVSTSDKCVRLYLETEYDILQTRGSVELVEMFVASVFNQVATLYQNENIGVNISDIFVWTTTDPYTGSNTTDLLNQFQTNRTSFDGDLGQLLTFRNVGGGKAAGYDGLCNPLVSKKLSVSGINNNFSNTPIYSWTVMVITHEFGHLLGSYHTHSCVWNGNNTAIDGCWSPAGCSNPGIPSGGGTIMSYCHTQSVGVNFALGFGLQPGNVIRNSVANASCLCDCVSSTISGSDFLCSSGSYSLQNPPSGLTASWSVTPTSLFSGSTSGNGTSVNLSASSGARGLAVLTFTVATTCGNVEVKKPL
ncbi:M12 family metallo-peptidase [Algoriphagus sp.]|uniref:M12 family metallo-peptidase n=1 Tax=Algoriphagus sp. TaxID=1872435 RepID=UPI003F72F0E0